MSTPAVSREEQVTRVYLERIRTSQPALAATPDEDLVTIGQGFCTMYDGGAVGADINDYILKAAGVAYTVHQLVDVHGAAVGAYCPEHTDKIG